MVETKDRIDDVADKAKRQTQERSATARTSGTEPEGAGAGGVVEAVRDKVQGAAAGASELFIQGKHTAQEWASSVGGAAVQATASVQEAASVAVKKAGDLGQDVTALIRRYPLPAVVVAVGVGFLLGQLLWRQSSRTD
jgi:ElaB/YqjD/DUF883 family membrane-anchored ribosome-binding protein